ncbi:hypothetical protein RJ639_003474 [Escallonia herrerae]|uniref:Uncharacterized protein n=1 Tax=Escallonia herrerae TaxID=1293975 RepID=A0AA88W0D8_9ASTE|nr:hypothetical protein RJ639_003474 [Escallonia herrerae]
MGNCLFGGMGDHEDNHGAIKVITSSGGVMEFYAPITVESITEEFRGHGLFRSHDLFWKPIPHTEMLLPGESYYLLPLGHKPSLGGQIAQLGHVRSNSTPTSIFEPYRMSFDGQRMLKRSYTDGWHSRFNSSSSGVWKVKLVISPERLLEILSQEVRTQELIENVRTVAKCGNGPSQISGVLPAVEMLTLRKMA